MHWVITLSFGHAERPWGYECIKINCSPYPSTLPTFLAARSVSCDAEHSNFKKCVSFTKLLFLSKVHSAELFFFNSCPFSFPSLIKNKIKIKIRNQILLNRTWTAVSLSLYGIEIGFCSFYRSKIFLQRSSRALIAIICWAFCWFWDY